MTDSPPATSEPARRPNDAAMVAAEPPQPPDGQRRSRTGDADIDRMIDDLLRRSGGSSNRDQLADIIATAVRMAQSSADRLDLKIANAALKEMADAFEVFAPYRRVPKVTIFGSARTLPDAPLYAQARQAAKGFADAGWMVVTGAGPGIMAAGQEGAGPGRSFGVNIRLPFEQGANAFIASDPKLVEMKYFFTRKLMLMKESDGFLVLPGGFGTLDEAYELLTLLQTGKAEPAPIVFLDVPHDSYWVEWDRFLHSEVTTRGLVSRDDRSLYNITDDAGAAVEEVLGFYRNYHSCRWVGELLVIRMRQLPSPAELIALNQTFADLVVDGGIEATEPLAVEVRGHDALPLARLRLRFNHSSYGRLRQLIDALNRIDGLPDGTSIA
jgi:uncharacterized protein (TIGR00730 family)